MVEFVADLLEDSDLEFAYVAKYDEQLIPEYPAVQIQPGPTDKMIHGTHTFAIALRAYIYIMHANLDESKQVRSYEDLLLATRVVELLEDDLSFGGRFIDAFVETENFGAMPISKDTAVVSTRLGFTAKSQSRFK